MKNRNPIETNDDMRETPRSAMPRRQFLIASAAAGTALALGKESAARDEPVCDPHESCDAKKIRAELETELPGCRTAVGFYDKELTDNTQLAGELIMGLLWVEFGSGVEHVSSDLVVQNRVVVRGRDDMLGRLYGPAGSDPDVLPDGFPLDEYRTKWRKLGEDAAAAAQKRSGNEITEDEFGTLFGRAFPGARVPVGNRLTGLEEKAEEAGDQMWIAFGRGVRHCAAGRRVDRRVIAAGRRMSYAHIKEHIDACNAQGEPFPVEKVEVCSYFAGRRATRRGPGTITDRDFTAAWFEVRDAFNKICNEKGLEFTSVACA